MLLRMHGRVVLVWVAVGDNEGQVSHFRKLLGRNLSRPNFKVASTFIFLKCYVSASALQSGCRKGRKTKALY